MQGFESNDEKLQTVMSNHESMVVWTASMNGSFTKLAERIIQLELSETPAEEWLVKEGPFSS
jgi:hypothetical protein